MRTKLILQITNICTAEMQGKYENVENLQSLVIEQFIKYLQIVHIYKKYIHEKYNIFYLYIITTALNLELHKVTDGSTLK